MFNNNKDEQQRYVQLNKPKNKRYLLILLVCAIGIGIVVSSKYWLPDGRTNVTTYDENRKYSFSNSEVVIEKVVYNPEKMLGEIRVRDRITAFSNYKDISYKMIDDKGREIPSRVIQSDFVPSDKSNRTGSKWTIIQFAIRPDYYYFSMIMEDDGFAKREVKFDYRNVPKQDLIEKGEDYLKTAPALFITIEKLQTDIEILDRNLKDIEPEITKAKNAVNTAEAENKEAKEKALNELIKEKEEIEKNRSARQEELKQYQDKKDEWDKQ